MNSCKNSCRRDSYYDNMGMPSTNCSHYSCPVSPPGCGSRNMMKNGSNMGCRNEGRKYLDDMPLAMAYVPLQKWRDIYQADEALNRGTIFKELDLPFTGRRPC